MINSLYWSIVTATTLGYGDFSPHSTEGKLITSLLIMCTVFIMIPATTANIASWLMVNRDTFTHEEQEDIKQKLNELHAMLSSQQTVGGILVSKP